jgi:hypothetical protein
MFGVRRCEFFPRGIRSGVLISGGVLIFTAYPAATTGRLV